MVWRVMRNVAAVPHAADDVSDGSPCRGTVALRQFPAQVAARIENRAIAMIVVRQNAIVDDKCKHQAAKYRSPKDEHPREPRLGQPVPRVQYQPESKKQPDRIAPHR